MAKYRVLVGMDYPPNRRVEAGDLVDDLPGKSIKWLLESGAVESADSTAKPAPFKPNATDGDGDGLVQDGTVFERPATEEK